MRALVLVLAFAGAAAAQDDAFFAPPEPDGYRMEAYRAPVPTTLTGAMVVDAEAAHALWEAGAAFVDSLPRAPKPENLPAGTIWHEPPRETIPGSVWLPNTGYGALAPAEAAYFQAGLEAATGDDSDRPLVFFCLPECWMSWNAAKRALGMGYTQVTWFPDGSAGWTAAGFSTEAVAPWQP